MIKICMIGYGHWGAILLKNFIRHKKFEVKYICDRNQIKLTQASSVAQNNCILINNPNQAFEDPDVDLIVIATQASYHFDLSIAALQANKHIFVEKPFTLNSNEAEIIFQMAKKVNKKVWVDHTFLFTSAYRKLKKCIHQGMIGKPMRFHSTRTAFGLFQSDANIIWHLMVHDIYILLDLFHTVEKINSIISSASIIPDVVDSVIASIAFPNQLHATIHCDMLFAEKKREITITGDKGILVWDETQQNKLLFYPHRASYNPLLKRVTYQSGQTEVIKIDESEALANEIDRLSEFLDNENQLTFPSQSIMLEIIKTLELIEAMDRKLCPIIT